MLVVVSWRVINPAVRPYDSPAVQRGNAFRIVRGLTGKQVRKPQIDLSFFFFFFFYEKPILFAICNNTLSKWKVGRLAWRRVLSSAPL
jgi:hypothetical protein